MLSSRASARDSFYQTILSYLISLKTRQPILQSSKPFSAETIESLEYRSFKGRSRQPESKNTSRRRRIFLAGTDRCRIEEMPCFPFEGSTSKRSCFSDAPPSPDCPFPRDKESETQPKPNTAHWSQKMETRATIQFGSDPYQPRK